VWKFVHEEAGEADGDKGDSIDWNSHVLSHMGSVAKTLD
jgi:hypothetical protein